MECLIDISFALRDREGIACGKREQLDTVLIDAGGDVSGTQIVIRSCICRISHQVEKAMKFKAEFHSSFVLNGSSHLGLGGSGDVRQKSRRDCAKADETAVV